MLSQKIGLCVLGAGALLSGCGGGGGDAMEVAKVPLSSTNYTETAQTVTAGIVGSGSVFSTMDSSAAAGAAAQGPSDWHVLGTGRVGAVGRYALSRLTAVQPKLERPAAVSQTTENCQLGGTLTFIENDADNNGEESAGDSVTVTAKNCIFDADTPAINGSLSLRLLAVNYDRDGFFLSGSADMTFTNFSSAGMVLNGGAVFSEDATKTTLSYKNLTSSYAGQTLGFDYSIVMRFDVSPSTANVDGVFAINGSRYTLSTPSTMRLGAVYPTSGTLRITDGHGNKVDTRMFSTGFESNLYLAGDAALDDTAFVLWSAL